MDIMSDFNTGDNLGNLAIGEIGPRVNYEVTLKWVKSEERRGMKPQR
jgi:hypothetical protein